ncbi:MAG TPA: sodium:proton antiporter [Bacteroidales bacterium]|nr:MAG: sodium:proton antiporter [Bacteroidetes bacterium GWF2_33_38]OFY76669.1 MAG: sodium:proton antiporter [Bacteroidetes bacterium RIFOXYA12_FULL_33_9]OFY86771.1 MAG: sodium:proton antiporter [Bacteroidetes bacterium RIFOXYA2_FULL_33_7]HBF88301.1 sodium:proton antiporter [Bacteroidales bacterium]
MSFSKEEIRIALEKVIHPEHGKNIVELGYLEGLKVEENDVFITIHLPKINDPFKTSIEKAAIKTIQTLVSDKLNIVVKFRTPVKKESKVTNTDKLSGINKIIAVYSGKGGVGKSTIAVNLAVALALKGYKVGLLDADVYGPSIPKMTALENARPNAIQEGTKNIIVPIEKFGLKILSIGFFVNPTDPVVWRGPMATSVIKQLTTEAEWGELDYLVIDFPPGTSDVHLTLVQTLKISGAVIVSTPQNVALSDALKGINMFRNKDINVPILGLVENMAWFTPENHPDEKYYIFGKEGCKKLASSENLDFLGQVPLVQGLQESSDSGEPIAINEKSLLGKVFSELSEKIVHKLSEK